MRHAVIEKKNSLLSVPHTRKQRCAQVCGIVFGERFTMPILKQNLVCAVEICGLCDRSGACEFVMQEHCVRLEDHAQASLPEPHAIVGILVVSGFVSFVKPAHLIPELAWRQKKGARTIVHIAPEHVRRSKRIVSATIPKTRPIAPDDASGFLKRTVEKD